MSQFIQYARACSSYECFILRAVRLSCKLLGQGYVNERLKLSLGKFYGRYRDLIKHYDVPLSQMLHDILEHDHIQWHPPLIKHFTKSWPCYRIGPYYRFWRYYLIPWVSIGERMWLANRERLLLRIYYCPIWEFICSNVETILSWPSPSLRNFWVSNIPR